MSGASILFSMKDGFAKYLGLTYPVLEIIWIQYSAMLIIFLPIVVIKYGWANLMPKSPKAQLMRGIYAVSAVGLFYLAVTDIPLADATALIFITPIIVTILSPFMLKEHVGFRRWIAVFVGFGGVLLIVQPGLQELRMGTLAGLSAGFLFALFSISSRKLAQQDAPLLTVVYTALVGAVGLTVATPAFFVIPAPSDIWPFVGMVVLAALGQVMMMHAFVAAPAVVVTPFFYVTILAASGIGYYVFGDFPNSLSWVGVVVLIGVGIYIAVRESRIKETVQ
ncbi:MAG: DMT family transporter [Rhodospirillales bacterium]|nr:DMT family transporter [Rhodospirillales bacterium]